MAASDRATSSGSGKRLNGVQEQAGLFWCSARAFKDAIVFQEGEDGVSSRADVPWGHKLKEALRVAFSHEQDGLLAIGKLALNQLQSIRKSHDRLNLDNFAGSHEPSTGLECTNSSAGGDPMFIQDDSKLEVTVGNSAKLEETTYKLERVLDQSMTELLPRATSNEVRKNLRAKSSERPSGAVSPSPSQVCPFLPDVETPIEPTCRAPPAGNSLTTLACGLLPTRLRRSKNLKEVKGDGKSQEVLTQVSTKANPLRMLRKLLWPACASSNSTAPKMATDNARKNMIELFCLESQYEEHFPTRESTARIIKARNWPYRTGGEDDRDPVLKQRLQPQSSRLLEKDKELSEMENQLERTCAAKHRRGLWIKTDSEYLVLEM